MSDCCECWCRQYIRRHMLQTDSLSLLTFWESVWVDTSMIIYICFPLYLAYTHITCCGCGVDQYSFIRKMSSWRCAIGLQLALWSPACCCGKAEHRPRNAAGFTCLPLRETVTINKGLRPGPNEACNQIPSLSSVLRGSFAKLAPKWPSQSSAFRRNPEWAGKDPRKSPAHLLVFRAGLQI